MAESVRRAGEGRLSSGETVTWTIADGTRGQRWREALVSDGRLVRSVLVEVGVDGSIGRLEVASAAGLLTVHPAADAATLHGNVVSFGGIRHLTLGWSGAHRLVVDRSPAMAAIALAGLAPDPVPTGSTRRLPVVWIGDDLRPAPADLIVTRREDGSWDLEIDDATGCRRIPVPGPGPFSVGPLGLPVLSESSVWPLER